MNPTEVFRTCKLVKGVNDDTTMNAFIQEFAPNKKVRSNAYFVCVWEPRHEKYAQRERWNMGGRYVVDYAKRHDLIKEVQKNIRLAQEGSPYAKLPHWGFTNLYMCSVAYGHSDYNKWRALPIEGNEKFCEWLIAYAKKYIDY